MLRQKWATAATVDTIPQSSTYGSSPSWLAAARYTSAVMVPA